MSPEPALNFHKDSVFSSEDILICGVFDLIHVNHINFLHKSKNIGDKLIVLINTDRFVSTYKRIPIINENDRLQMIQNILYNILKTILCLK